MVGVTGGGVGGSISGLLPVQLRRLEAEEREPRADAAGGVVDDATLPTTHANWGVVPKALGAPVDEARTLRRAERAHTGEWHQDEVVGRAAVVAELVLEVRAARHEVGRAPRAAVEQRAQAGATLDLRSWLMACLCLGSPLDLGRRLEHREPDRVHHVSAV